MLPLRMCLCRLLIGQSPRYLLTRQCRRFSTAPSSYLWTLPCRRSHTVLFLRTLLRSRALAQLFRFLLTCLFRLLYAVLYYTILPQNYRSRSSLLDVSSRMILFDRQASSSAQGDTGSASPPQPRDIATTCSLSSSSLDSDGHVHTMAPRVLLQPPPVSNSMPRLQVSIMMPTCALHMVYLLKRHHCDPVYVQLSQSRPHSHLLVPPKWEHFLCAQLLPAREVLVPPLREPTILSMQILVQGLALFLNREPLVLPLVKFGQSKPDGHGYIDTADSDLMQSRPGAQKSYYHCLCFLWKVSYSYSSRSQRSRSTHL